MESIQEGKFFKHKTDVMFVKCLTGLCLNSIDRT